MSEVIRYGAGGKPYVGKVGPKSTVDLSPKEEELTKAKPNVKVKVSEDDTPLTDQDVAKRVRGEKK